MLPELFGMLSTIDVNAKGSGVRQKFNINANRNHIRSISAYSSNSIFYFRTIVSDQLTPEEVAMTSRFLEKSYASFVVSCISLMPFHRIRSDDQASIEDYLSQFHQNMGISDGNRNMSKIIGIANSMLETGAESNVTAEDIRATQSFLEECWNRSRTNETDFMDEVQETVPLHEMYNLDPIDPVTRVIQEAYKRNLAELETWGFVGEATADMYDAMDDFDEDEALRDLGLGELDAEDLENLADEYEDDILGEEWDDDLDEGAITKRIGGTRAVWSKYYKEALAENKTVEQAKDYANRKVGEIKGAMRKARDTLKGETDEIRASAERMKQPNSKEKKMLFGKDNRVQSTKGDPRKRIQESTALDESLSDLIRRRRVKRLAKLMTPEQKQEMANREAEQIANSKYNAKRRQEYHEEFREDQKAAAHERAVRRGSRMDEAGVASAIDHVRFSLESVSENKIMSCSSLTKLNGLESRLNKLKTKYTQYLNRYKKLYTENQKNGTNRKLKIRFNGAQISDPRAFMQQYGEYIGIINQRLRMVAKRRSELRKRKGLPDSSEDQRLHESGVSVLMEDDLITVDSLIEDIQSSIDAPTDSICEYVEEPVDEASAPNGRHGSNDWDTVTTGIKNAVSAADKVYDLYGKMTGKDEGREDHWDTEHPYIKDPRAEVPPQTGIVYRNNQRKGDLNVAAAASRSSDGRADFKTFDKEVFTKMDMQKANDAIPTFAKASIGFIVDETEQVVTRDVLVGIKTFVHAVPAKDLVDDIYNALINKRKFLKFVKWISGEEKSLADLLFGYKELRLDAQATKKPGVGQWLPAMRSRKRMSKFAVPYLMKNFTPNGTVVLTMNEVKFIKDEYGLDIMRPDHVKMLMDQNFLLGFVILDQANEKVYVTYDGHEGNFQQYTYAMLEREQNTSDRLMRELYRSMAR